MTLQWMRNTGPVWVLAVLVLTTLCLPAQAQRNYPIDVTLDAATIQASMIAVDSTIAVGNSVPISLKAQLLRKTPEQPPFDFGPLKIGSYELTWISGSTFAASCATELSNTVLSCLLTPGTSAGWSAGPMRYRLQIKSTDGFSSSAMMSYTFSPPGPGMQWQLVGVPGKIPAATNGEPLTLTAQLARSGGGLALDALVNIASADFTALPASIPFAAGCTVVGTKTFQCTITPSGPAGTKWTPGVLMARLTMVSVDGLKYTQIATFNVNLPGAQLDTRGPYCAAPPACPAPGNANPTTLIVQLAKTGSYLSPISAFENFHVIGSFQVESLEAGVNAICQPSPTQRAYKCTLTPVSATWGDTPYWVRLTVTSTEGPGASTTLRIMN